MVGLYGFENEEYVPEWTEVKWRNRGMSSESGGCSVLAFSLLPREVMCALPSFGYLPSPASVLYCLLLIYLLHLDNVGYLCDRDSYNRTAVVYLPPVSWLYYQLPSTLPL